MSLIWRFFLHNHNHLTHISSNELFIQVTAILNKFVPTNSCTLYSRSLYYSQHIVIIGAMRCNYEYVHLWYSVSRCLLTVLLAGLFSRFPAGLHLTWGICCPLPTFCPYAPSFICAYCLLLYHTLGEKQQMHPCIIRMVFAVFFRCTTNIFSSEFCHRLVCVKAFKRPHSDKLFRFEQDWVCVCVFGRWKRDVISFRRSDNRYMLKRYILAQLGPSAAALASVCLFVFRSECQKYSPVCDRLHQRGANGDKVI